MSDGANRGISPTSSELAPAARLRGWPAFQYEFDRFMTLRQMSPTELATRLAKPGVNAETVRQWRRKTKPQRPAFEFFPAIAEALTMSDDPAGTTADPTYLPRKMGIIDDVKDRFLIEKSLMLAKKRNRLESMRKQLEALSAGGLGALVEEVTQSGSWAIAVWPAVEGFAQRFNGHTYQYDLHVADRIDIRRTDGLPTSDDEVWTTFEERLDFAGAFHTGATQPRWAPPADPTREVGDNVADERPSTWAIRHVGRVHSSVVDFAYPRLSSVTVTSLSVNSWANDVASHLAKLLGYGLDSTRDHALNLYGHRSLSETGEERASFQRYLLDDPRAKRVWSHWSSGHDAAELLAGTSDNEVVHVYLREDDDSLRRESTRIEHWRSSRVVADKAAPAVNPEDALFARRLEIDQYIKSGAAGKPFVYAMQDRSESLSEGERRVVKFRRAFEVAAQALEDFVDRELVDRDRLEQQWRLGTDPHRDTLVRYLREIRRRYWGD